MAHKLFPAIHWYENLIFDSQGRVWGVYRLPQFPYEHRGQSDKLSVSEKLERFLHRYSGKGMLLSVARQKSLRQLEKQMRSRSDNEEWQRHVDAAKEELKTRLAYDREVYWSCRCQRMLRDLRSDTALSSRENLKQAMIQAGKQAIAAIREDEEPRAWGRA